MAKQTETGSERSPSRCSTGLSSDYIFALPDAHSFVPWTALPTCELCAPSAVSSFHPSACTCATSPSSLEHMELSRQATLSKFTDGFTLIAFLSGCFPECAGRARNSPMGGRSCRHSHSHSHSPGSSGKIPRWTDT